MTSQANISNHISLTPESEGNAVLKIPIEISIISPGALLSQSLSTSEAQGGSSSWASSQQAKPPQPGSNFQRYKSHAFYYPVN
jgi:hypothetical protein